MSEVDIRNMLLKEGVEADLATDASRIAEGSLQKAEEIALHPEELTEFSNLFKDMMRAAYALKAKQLKEISENIAGFGREKIMRFLNYCGRMIRENYIYNFNLPELVLMTPEESEFSSRFAPFIHDDNVEQLSEEIARASQDVERNANTKIVLFDLFLLLSRLVRKPRPSNLFGRA